MSNKVKAEINKKKFLSSTQKQQQQSVVSFKHGITMRLSAFKRAKVRQLSINRCGQVERHDA